MLASSTPTPMEVVSFGCDAVFLVPMVCPLHRRGSWGFRTFCESRGAHTRPCQRDLSLCSAGGCMDLGTSARGRTTYGSDFLYGKR